MVIETARAEAMKQWNARACGELEGTKDSVEYFSNVEADRYAQQPWQHGYFRFDQFAGKDVLEIGIGQGTDLLQFGKAGARCHGVDITDNHITITRRNFQVHGIPVDIRKIDATTLPFPDASMDCVYSFGVVHHIPEAEKVIAEAKRVLRPGGTLYLALYYKWSAFYLYTKLLRDGLLRGWLFRKGHAGLLATIEMGADGVRVKPYVTLYSKRRMRALISGFDVSDISVHQLHADQIPLFMRWLVPNRTLRWLDGKFGWYVACKASKPRT
jgi:SAM-dependent methyltransferase